LAFSPDGKTLTSYSVTLRGGTVRRWDLGTGRGTDLPFEVDSFKGEFAFSQDVTLLACTDRNTICVLDIESRQQVSTRHLHEDVVSIACLPGGKGFATFSGSKLQQWNNALEEIQPSQQLHANDAVCHIAITPDGKTLATASMKTIYFWGWPIEINKLPLTAIQPAMGQPATGQPSLCAMVFSPDGRTLAVAFEHESLTWVVLLDWAAASGRRQKKYWFQMKPPCGRGCFGLAFSPDGRTLAVADPGPGILLWDISKESEDLIIMSTADGYDVRLHPIEDVRFLDDECNTVLSIANPNPTDIPIITDWNIEEGTTGAIIAWGGRVIPVCSPSKYIRSMRGKHF
jgi:WD40 repeat protein